VEVADMSKHEETRENGDNNPIYINCDIGERGADHPQDRELMAYIHIANIACGGHAGDETSIAAFRGLAEKHGVKVSAHLSYPDRENFGRTSLVIRLDELLESLADQLRLMEDVQMVKLHGALYNDSSSNPDLAAGLASWFAKNSVTTVLAPEYSEMAAACKREGIGILAEAFAERRYVYDPETMKLELVSRSKDYACIYDCEEAVEQVRSIVRDGRVTALKEGPDGSLERRWIGIQAQSVCIHSDSPIALELAKRLSGMSGRY
jgi:UPF0271 protein